MRMIKTVWVFVFLLATASCAGESSSGKESSLDYNDLKTMVKDIIQTEEGQKTIKEVLTKDEVKHELILSQPEIKQAVLTALTSEQGQKQLKEMFDDPKFAATVAKTMQKENETLLKTLMKDPEYQGMLLDVWKDPQFEKQLLDLMKSKAYREQTAKVVEDTVKSPLFQEKLMRILEKVQEEASKPEKNNEEKGSGHENQGDEDGSAEEGGSGGGSQ
ncbi:MAG: Spore germination protein GerD [Candidatus Carbobacillus altaicus]|uniref:Spore germination protein GerD n=1 Tax=Candidatus Carbonibacillus altaicus TaxID=2163959 RepID=A0A2R6Y2P5_9BACL|nr:MAG: Spore germination protein GerD [Candidatus Carbobacillus altaicus]